MATVFDTESLEGLRGAPVYDRAGEKIGEIEEIFYAEGSSQPEWLGIGTGFFGTKRVLVPLAGAKPAEGGVMVAYDKELVKDAPDIDSDDIDEETAGGLWTHYFGGHRSADDEGSVTRSEEELQVGKRSVEAGSVRLRKRVETEPVEVDVELKRETAHVTREAIDEPVGDHEFSEEEIEVPLHAESPVVRKEAVAKERIGVEKSVESERETIVDEVRKERVEVEDDSR